MAAENHEEMITKTQFEQGISGLVTKEQLDSKLEQAISGLATKEQLDSKIAIVDAKLEGLGKQISAVQWGIALFAVVLTGIQCFMLAEMFDMTEQIGHIVGKIGN